MASGNSQTMSIIFLIAIFFIFYLLIIRPSQVKQKQHMEMLKNLNKGDKVVIQSGIHGEITRIKDKTIHLKIADKTEIVVDKSAVMYVIKPKENKQE